MSAFLILFPCQPGSPSKVDPALAEEYEAARVIGFSTFLYDHLALTAGEAREAFQDLPSVGAPCRTIFRSWMVPGEIYELAYEELISRGYVPEVTPEGYDEAHYLPLAYRHLVGDAPRSQWIEGEDVEEAWELYQSFQGGDAIIKDWVKSAKRRWREGCFIPAGTTKAQFREIFSVFRTERGARFNRGVVLREFLPIVERGSEIHGLPLIEETRLFFWQNQILVPPSERSPSPLDEQWRWEEIARRFRSPFLTIDVAFLTDGTWKVVEVGDGGVSGLPMGLDPERFFAALWNRVGSEAGHGSR